MRAEAQSPPTSSKILTAASEQARVDIAKTTKMGSRRRAGLI